MSEYSVGWTPTGKDWGHVQIETPRPDGAVNGHLEAARAVIAGLTPTDPSQGATLWELEVAEAAALLESALRHRRQQ